MNKAEALQEAKIRYLEESDELAAHPAFWSAFIQIGDYEKIEIQQKGFKGWGWIAWSLGGTFLLMIIAAVLFLRKRTL
jgi:hypothetical protein